MSATKADLLKRIWKLEHDLCTVASELEVPLPGPDHTAAEIDTMVEALIDLVAEMDLRIIRSPAAKAAEEKIMSSGSSVGDLASERGALRDELLRSENETSALLIALYQKREDMEALSVGLPELLPQAVARITELLALEASAKGRICCGAVMHYHTNTSLKCEKCCTILVTG